MQPHDSRVETAFPPGHWPVFGHASPRRYARTDRVPGEMPSEDAVDQDFEEYEFE